jgi:hypothetical protein
MDVYVSTVAGERARSRTDAHADGSTFVQKRKPMISVGFARVSKNTSRVEALAE